MVNIIYSNHVFPTTISQLPPDPPTQFHALSFSLYFVFFFFFDCPKYFIGYEFLQMLHVFAGTVELEIIAPSAGCINSVVELVALSKATTLAMISRCQPTHLSVHQCTGCQDFF